MFCDCGLDPAVRLVVIRRHPIIFSMPRAVRLPGDPEADRKESAAAVTAGFHFLFR
jgi:hypothetical protein